MLGTDSSMNSLRTLHTSVLSVSYEVSFVSNFEKMFHYNEVRLSYVPDVINDCSNNTCQNGAICLDGINSYSCLCKTSFIGDHCQIGKCG